MNFTRRDLLAWSGGAVAGILFTPVPWKVLDDVSIWTQNFPWIPQPAKGPVEVKRSSCTLCANACGLKVRMAAGWPVGLAGVAEHPVSKGALCPLAYGAHQLNWHPRRLGTVLHRGRKASWEEAAAAFRKALAEGPVAIVDGRAGRAESQVLARFAASHRGTYAVVRTAEEKALAPYAEWSGVPAAALGYDLEHAATVITFGAPMLDGWGPPGRFTRLWSEDPERLVDARDVPAAAIARALIEQRLVAARGPMPNVAVSEGARELARRLVARGPAVAIAAGENREVAALNVILGAVGARGGIVRRGDAPAILPAEQVHGPLRAVVIDAATPWEVAPDVDAEVFRFAAWHGGSTRADWLLPAPGFLEALTDVPTAPASGIETYAIADALVTAMEGTKSAAAFVSEIDAAAGSVEAGIAARCEAIYRAKKGSLIAEKVTPVAEVESAKALREALMGGAVWAGEAASPGGVRCRLEEWPRAAAADARAGWTGDWSLPVLPPLAAKLYQESSLRAAPARRIV